MTSTVARRASSFRPSCSWSAVTSASYIRPVVIGVLARTRAASRRQRSSHTVSTPAQASIQIAIATVVS